MLFSADNIFSIETLPLSRTHKVAVRPLAFRTRRCSRNKKKNNGRKEEEGIENKDSDSITMGVEKQRYNERINKSFDIQEREKD